MEQVVYIPVIDPDTGIEVYKPRVIFVPTYSIGDIVTIQEGDGIVVGVEIKIYKNPNGDSQDDVESVEYTLSLIESDELYTFSDEHVITEEEKTGDNQYETTI